MHPVVFRGINTGSKVTSCGDPLSWFITYCISRAAVPEPDLQDPTVTPRPPPPPDGDASSSGPRPAPATPLSAGAVLYILRPPGSPEWNGNPGGGTWWSGRGGFCRVVFGQHQKPWRLIVFMGLNAIGCLLDPPSHSGPPRVRSGKPPNSPWEGDPSSAFLTLDTLDCLFARN